MEKVKIEKLIRRLAEIPEQKFCVGNIQDFLRENPVCPDSLAPYLFFSKNCYTRNLIFKNEMFEAMAICWNAGQQSLIHDHAGQNCWMAMPIGKLRIKNFRLLEQDPERNYCRLEETETFDLTRDCPAEVELEEPLHQVINPAEFDAQAVSLHIYSRPFERCNVFSLQKNEMRERVMCYTSVNGKLCDGVKL